MALQSYKSQLIQLTRLAFPILIAQLAQNSMGLVDTIMAGQVSTDDMAAISISASIWLPLILFGQGLLLALPPTISYLNGSGKRHLIAHQIHQGMWIAFFISIPVMLISYYSEVIINTMKMDQHLADISINYLKAMAFGAFPYLLMITFRGLNDGIAKTMPAMIIAFIMLLLNIPLNYIFIYGKFGLPAYGAVGCGISTAILNWVGLFLILIYCYKTPSQKDLNVFRHFFELPHKKTLKKLLRLGIPIALAICSEIFLFRIISILIARYGANEIASHQIGLNTSSFIYMLPVSIAMATTILVGQSLGQHKPEQAKQFTNTALVLGLSVTVITAILVFSFRYQIAEIFVKDPVVIKMAAVLLIFEVIYQFPDAVQAITGGALRGYKDIKPILWVTLFSYCLVGLPIGYILGMTNLIVPNMMAKGFWIGFVLSLSLVAIMLYFRLKKIQAIPAEKLLADLDKIR
ncbi:MATE family efflux transporter [Mergibacter septicus]|uniref:MATE family efflux transporter n=1 Tax=Mergibacter septicus TaxID=221402 RepID=UPI0011790942|nr:MATE family efflux transporter [Mergibacter septicus]AWX13461.1 MATE family efflux transporter [Mergibacter septicus]